MSSRKAVVDTVMSWDGVKHGSAKHHEIIDIYNKKVGGMNYYAAWCAATASAAAIKAGAADLYPLGISCGKIIEKARAMGIWVEDDRFVPSIGDWLVYDWNDGSGYAAYDNRDGHDHIGTVVAVGGSSFVVEEGNMGRPAHVGKRTVSVNGRYIRGFVHPRFPEDEPQKPGEPANDAGMHYRVHAQGVGWLPAVRDGQVAGTTGQSRRVEAIKMTPPAGVTLDVNVHLQGVGWVSYGGVRRGKGSGTGSSATDPIMGTVGQSRRLEAIQIHADGLPKGKRLLYRAHVQGKGWLPWVGSGQVAGTTGERRRLEAIQMKIV